MPLIDANGCQIHVEVEGPERAPVLMLSNSLGTTLHMWDPQVAPFTKDFRLVRFDRRGHGKSDVPKGPYSMELLGRDVLAIMDGLGIKKANWCGLSMGGMEGMWLGAHASDRFDRIILSNTSCHYPNQEFWNERIKTIRDAGGLGPLADRLTGAWFTKDYREREPATVEAYEDGTGSNAGRGLHRLRRGGARYGSPQNTFADHSATLVIIGRHDQATTPEAGQFIRSRIPGASLATIDAAHISNIEQPTQFTDAVLGFLHAQVRSQNCLRLVDHQFSNR